MKRNSAPLIVLLATLSVLVLGFIALCAVFLNVVLPRMHGKSALEEPANPNLTVADYNRRGNDLYRQRLFKRAAVEYGHMIEKAPTNVDGYLLRGMAESEIGDYAKAIRDDTDGLKYARLTEVRDPLYFNRGLAYRNKGDYKQAVPDFSQALALNPKNWNAYEVRAFCYTELQDYDRAIADYTIAIAQEPHPGTVFERGQAYLKKNDYHNALSDMNRSIAARPAFLPAYRLRAEAHIGLKQFDQAVADADKAAQMDNSAVSRGGLGWYQYLAGRLPDAIANSQAAIKMDPTLTFVHFNLGLCYAVQGNAETAKTTYEDGLTRAKPADIKGALQDVKDALRKHPNAPALKQAESLLQTALIRTS